MHAAVDGRGRPVRLILSPGQSGDAPRALPLLKDLPAKHVLADAAYDSFAIREDIASRGGVACIRPNRSRKNPAAYDRQRYRNRNIVERFFGFIKRWRRVATRYEKKAANFLGIVQLAATLVSMGSASVHTT